MADEQDQFTPAQARAVERLQLVGVVLLVLAVVGVRVLDRVTSISNWTLYGLGLAVMIVPLVAGAIVMGRIEGRPAREVAVRALRETKADLMKQAARLRRR